MSKKQWTAAVLTACALAGQAHAQDGPASSTKERQFKVVLDPHQGPVAEKHAKLGVACTQCHSPSTPVNAGLWNLYAATRDSASTLGVVAEPAEAGLLAQIGLSGSSGLVVTEVKPESGGAKLGLHVYDLLTAVGDRKLAKSTDLEEALRTAKTDPAILKLIREAKPLEINVTRSNLKTIFPDLVEAPASLPWWIGVATGEIEPAVRAQLKIKAPLGLVLSSVIEGGPAEKAKLKTNDILLAVDDRAVEKNTDLVEAVQKSGGKAIQLKLFRGGKEIRIGVAPEKRPAQYAANAPKTQEVLPYRLWTTVQPGVVQNHDYMAMVDAMKKYQGRYAGTPPAAERDAQLDAKLDRLGAQIENLQKALEALKADRTKSNR